MAAVGWLVFAASAQASTVRIAVSGNGITANVTLTLGADLYAGPLFGTGTTPNPTGPGYFGLADPINALSVTGAVGTFSDANLGLSNVAITDTSRIITCRISTTIRRFRSDFSWYTGVGFPAGASTLLSYDNLFYTGAGAPITCLGVHSRRHYRRLRPAPDACERRRVRRVERRRFRGYDLRRGRRHLERHHRLSRSIPRQPGLGGASAAANLSVTIVPEPSTWAMMMLGFAGLGFAGYRKARKTVAIAA